MIPIIQRALRCETGATAIEYSLIASCIAVVIIATVVLTGAELQAFFQSLAAAL